MSNFYYNIIMKIFKINTFFMILIFLLIKFLIKVSAYKVKWIGLINIFFIIYYIIKSPKTILK